MQIRYINVRMMSILLATGICFIVLLAFRLPGGFWQKQFFVSMVLRGSDKYFVCGLAVQDNQASTLNVWWSDNTSHTRRECMISHI